MSSDFTPMTSSTITHLYKGDRRLKRVALSIRSKKNPEEILPGYALMTELNDEMLSFFSTQKFLIDESLNIRMTVGADDLEFQLKLSHLHEQISSGRIMTSIPTEENPFPARKFYRCFAKVIDVKRNGLSLHEKPVIPEEAFAPTLQAVPDLGPDQAVPPVADPTLESTAAPESELKVA